MRSTRLRAGFGSVVFAGLTVGVSLTAFLTPAVAQPEMPGRVDVELEPEPEAVVAGEDAFAAQHREAHRRAVRQGAYGERVAWIQVKGRWAREVDLPLAAGDELTPARLSEAMQVLARTITGDSRRAFEFDQMGEVGVLYLDVDFVAEAPPTVPSPAGVKYYGLVFKPYYVRVSLARAGDKVLPIPRAALPTFYENVPPALLATRPTVGLSYDRAFGLAPSASLDTDLLALPATLKGRAGGEPRSEHLVLHAEGAKSVEEPFYRAASALAYAVRRTEQTLEGVELAGRYAGAMQPLDDAEHTRQAGEFGGSATLKLWARTRLTLGMGYRYAEDQLEPEGWTQPGPTSTTVSEQVNRVVLETLLGEHVPIVGRGFLRLGMWEDNSWLMHGADGEYQRWVGRVGFAKEFRIAPNQTVGAELLAGGGKVWGDAPAYARFYGGRSPGQFLYDSVVSPSLITMPPGPLVRSFGEQEAVLSEAGTGPRGGDTFWHVNLNLTLPIRFLSRPLIPDETTDLPGNPTLRQILKNQINSGASFMTAVFEKEGLSHDQALEKAREVYEDIGPATGFIIDEANLYAIKPLLMLDVAGLEGRQAEDDSTWLAAGGGLQVTLVTAKFEFGYMHTLLGPTFGDRGNFFFRLVFQNLF